jgi:hypothetical protein
MNTKDFAEKFIKAEDEAWLNGNFAALEKIEDPKVIYHMPPPMPDVAGFEAHKQYILGNGQLTSGLRQEWHYLTGEGSVFALSYKATGQFTGQIPGLPPTTGKNFINDFLFLFQLKKGKVTEVWTNGSMAIK